MFNELTYVRTLSQGVSCYKALIIASNLALSIIPVISTAKIGRASCRERVSTVV